MTIPNAIQDCFNSEDGNRDIVAAIMAIRASTTKNGMFLLDSCASQIAI